MFLVQVRIKYHFTFTHLKDRLLHFGQIVLGQMMTFLLKLSSFNKVINAGVTIFRLTVTDQW